MGERRPEFDKKFMALAADAAKHLVETRGETGRGRLSVGGSFRQQEASGSRTLLGAGVVIIEALNLSDVSAGDYELIALPVKLKGADGAPARVVLRTLK